MDGMQGHALGDAAWHRQHQADRTVRETMEAEIRFWRNRYEQLSESLHETLKAASSPLLLTQRESYEAGRLIGVRDSAARIEALEKRQEELLTALEEAIAGMGGSYAIWSVKAKAAIASVKGGAA